LAGLFKETSFFYGTPTKGRMTKDGTTRGKNNQRIERLKDRKKHSKSGKREDKFKNIEH